MLKRLAESPELCQMIGHYLNSLTIGSHAALSLPHVIVISPQKPKTPTFAWIYLKGGIVSVNFPEKREDFREIVKGLGYFWGRPVWQRLIDQRAGDPVDRAAELGHHLLANGFCVVFPSNEIIDLAISGSYKLEKRRWVLVRTTGQYQNWFALWWRHNDLYAEAMKLPGAHYSKPAVVVPPELFEEVLDFARIHDLEFSPAAKELLEKARAWRESAMIVSVADIKMPDKAIMTRPELEIKESEIDDDLADDFDFV